MTPHESFQAALGWSLKTLVFLVSVILFSWFYFDLSERDMSIVVLPLALLLSVLISIIVYQSVRMLGVAERIAKNLAEDMFLYSRELFTEIYRGSPVPYLLIDATGVVESTNYAAVRLFQIEEGALDGIRIFDRLETEEEARLGLIEEKFRHGLFVNEEEAQIKRPDGSTRWVLLSLFSFQDSKRKRHGLLTLVDITKQKQVDRAKSEFVSLASHQLRTPISSMKWNLELFETAESGAITDEQKAYFSKLKDGLTRMDLLIDDFLNVSKLELGTLIAQHERISLKEFIESIREEHIGHAHTKQIDLRVEWNISPRTIEADSHLLGMAVGNLVSNALKYTPEEGVVIIAVGEEGPQLSITVTDTGIGIPIDEQDQIFSKIFRASNARASAAEGTGLGLYIAREAIRVLGGTISFESKEGQGTAFTITLPW